MTSHRPLHRLAIVLAVAAAGSAFAPSPAAAQWTNGQNAAFVVGRPDFTSFGAAVTSTGLSAPSGIALDPARGKMYVADQSANRVLRYAWPVTSNTPAAELVFGQPDFTTSTANNGGIGPSSLSSPQNVALNSSGTLAICDRSNNRVLFFDNAHALATNAPPADRVLGQPDFTSSAFAQTASGLRGPFSMAFDTSGTLYIVDTDQHRLLRHANGANKPNGAAADGVLGQTDFVTGLNGTSASTFNSPRDVVAVGSAVFVAESNNHRVVRFDNAAAKADGAPADAVLLQPNFTTNTLGTAIDRSNQAHGLAADAGGRLYVAERANRRITVFANAAGLASGAPADFVLGQADFTTNGGATTAARMNLCLDVAVDSSSGYLAAADSLSSRILIFQAAATLVPVTVSAVAIE